MTEKSAKESPSNLARNLETSPRSSRRIRSRNSGFQEGWLAESRLSWVRQKGALLGGGQRVETRTRLPSVSFKTRVNLCGCVRVCRKRLSRIVQLRLPATTLDNCCWMLRPRPLLLLSANRRLLFRKFATEAGEDYLKVHRPAMYWFPSRKPTSDNDEREIGPYPQQFPLTSSSSDPAGSFQFRPADLSSYFDRQNRRRFGEAVPEEAEFLGMWNVDIEGDYSIVYMLGGLVLLFGTVGTVAYLSTKYHDPLKSPRLLAVNSFDGAVLKIFERMSAFLLTRKIIFVFYYSRSRRSCHFKKSTLKANSNLFTFGPALSHCR